MPWSWTYNKTLHEWQILGADGTTIARYHKMCAGAWSWSAKVGGREWYSGLSGTEDEARTDSEQLIGEKEVMATRRKQRQTTENNTDTAEEYTDSAEVSEMTEEEAAQYRVAENSSAAFQPQEPPKKQRAPRKDKGIKHGPRKRKAPNGQQALDPLVIEATEYLAKTAALRKERARIKCELDDIEASVSEGALKVAQAIQGALPDQPPF